MWVVGIESENEAIRQLDGEAVFLYRSRKAMLLSLRRGYFLDSGGRQSHGDKDAFCGSAVLEVELEVGESSVGGCSPVP